MSIVPARAGTIELSVEYELQPPSPDAAVREGGIKGLLAVLHEAIAVAKAAGGHITTAASAVASGTISLANAASLPFATEKPLHLLRLAMEDVWVTCRHAEQLLALFKGDHHVDAMACILPQVIDSANVPALISRCFTGAEQLALKQRLGQLFWFCARAPNDRYTLNLANEMDALVLERLVALNNVERNVARATEGKPDTSFSGDRSCFRNAVRWADSACLKQLLPWALADKPPP